MELHWLGRSCFRLKSRGATVVTDPYGSQHGRLGGLTADVVTVSHAAAGASVPEIGGSPRVVRGPGEYDVRGVWIEGVQTVLRSGAKVQRNTVFLIDVDDVVVCHLGGLREAPSREELDAIGHPDVLLVPLGVTDGLAPIPAGEIVTALDPRVVVPVVLDSGPSGEDTRLPLETFCRLVGGASAPQARLQLTRAQLPDDRRVMLLERRRPASLARVAAAA